MGLNRRIAACACTATTVHSAVRRGVGAATFPLIDADCLHPFAPHCGADNMRFGTDLAGDERAAFSPERLVGIMQRSRIPSSERICRLVLLVLTQSDQLDVIVALYGCRQNCLRNSRRDSLRRQGIAGERGIADPQV